jgi:hypothetical protein
VKESMGGGISQEEASVYYLAVELIETGLR